METKIRMEFLLALLFTKALCETGIVKIHRDKLFSGHVMFVTCTPMWLPCAKLCSRIKACKSINFIAWNKTCQINDDEPGNHTDGLLPAVGTTFVAEPSFREVFEGPCECPVCKLNEICQPKAPMDICVPLFAPYGEFEKRFNGDNTAANYVRFKCRNINSAGSGTTLGTSGLWGDYGAWSEYCAVGSAICGLKVRIQLPQGVIIDDTALNDVQFFCCKN
ncbi:Hypothetical predicted protein [Mytilus galloprovincialis]|uniref:Apple domain-containing protein n=1 Tax=Mytilus galloprovincialis TaxID=29158 RepID=A0A8B6EUS9_MYTGA|nr:Hypothetical predicted protein [Mytilus galloprovincialis]